jgi:hypothetical protein
LPTQQEAAKKKPGLEISKADLTKNAAPPTPIQEEKYYKSVTPEAKKVSP